MAAEKKTFLGELGKGAFWGAVISLGLNIVRFFSPLVAAGMFTWGVIGTAIAGTVYGIGKLADAVAPKPEAT